MTPAEELIAENATLRAEMALIKKELDEAIAQLDAISAEKDNEMYELQESLINEREKHKWYVTQLAARVREVRVARETKSPMAEQLVEALLADYT